ncbi:hypothetical protein Hypma_014093 [Hypsizygus marmoreus]|uniref:Uncharacterized protein n=1 Tax=Hypsizygus marmoreus TaxID=39966 RepID=A0A369K973_HYPMA|nr:hypothetical protein Hypma_014093 [Hypsizygus marmoreus]
MSGSDALTASFRTVALSSPTSRPNTKPEEEEVAKPQVIRLEPREMPFFRISPTPAAAGTSPRYYFYGWPVHFEPFIELARKSGYRSRELAAEYTMVDAVMYI